MKLPLTMIITLALSLAACHNHTNDYVNAKNTPALKTPPGISNPTFVDHNPIPAAAPPTPVSPPSLVPPGLTEDEAAAKVALAKAKKNPEKADDVKKTASTESVPQQP